jgi:nucleotide-binding universal stress UspA family protein
LTRVLVPLDLSDTSRGALAVALSWASALRGSGRVGASTRNGPVALTALVVKTRGADAGRGDAQETLEQELHRLRAEAGSWAKVEISAAVRSSSDVVTTIADHAREEQSDLVVLGTRGLGAGAVGRLGSVSLGVTQAVTTPILLVPPAVWAAHAAEARA